MRTGSIFAVLLAGTCAASANGTAKPDPAAVHGPVVLVADAMGSPDAIQAPVSVGSGPGDVATPPAPFPFPGFRSDLPHARTASAPSVALPGDGTQSVREPTRDGHAETAVGGPLGDLALVRRIVQGGSEEPSPGPLDGHAGYRDLVGHWLDEASKQVVPAELPPGARRDVPSEGYSATVAITFPYPVAAKAPNATASLEKSAPSPRAGDPCRFGRGGTVEVVGRDPDLGTLVRYAADTSEGQAACPNGTYAFMPVRVLSGWPAAGDVAANARAAGERAAAAATRILTERGILRLPLP